MPWIDDLLSKQKSRQTLLEQYQQARAKKIAPPQRLRFNPFRDEFPPPPEELPPDETLPPLSLDELLGQRRQRTTALATRPAPALGVRRETMGLAELLGQRQAISPVSARVTAPFRMLKPIPISRLPEIAGGAYRPVEERAIREKLGVPELPQKPPVSPAVQKIIEGGSLFAQLAPSHDASGNPIPMWKRELSGIGMVGTVGTMGVAAAQQGWQALTNFALVRQISRWATERNIAVSRDQAEFMSGQMRAYAQRAGFKWDLDKKVLRDLFKSTAGRTVPTTEAGRKAAETAQQAVNRYAPAIIPRGTQTGAMAFGGLPKPIGREVVAYGPDPTKSYQMRYRLVEIEDLIPSHTDAFAPNPAYPKELQPRLRERGTARLAVTKMARDLVPEVLIKDDNTLDRGPMIIGNDNVVESGNGRIMALRLAQQSYPERWQAYQKALQEALPQFEIDETQLAQMRNPVLVRERISDVDRVQFASEANQPVVAVFSPLENALQDARRIRFDTLVIPEETQSLDVTLRMASNRPFVTSFLETLPANERASLLDSAGDLNLLGMQRIKAAMFAATYPGESGRRLTQIFFESREPLIRNIEEGMLASLPKVARAEELVRAGNRGADLSIGEDLAKSLHMLAVLRQRKLSVAQYLAQRQMFERELTPFQERLLQHAETIARSPRKVREFLGDYADAVVASPHPQQAAMIAGRKLTKEELFNATVRRAEEGPLFAAAETEIAPIPAIPAREPGLVAEAPRIPEAKVAPVTPEVIRKVPQLTNVTWNRMSKIRRNQLLDEARPLEKEMFPGQAARLLDRTAGANWSDFDYEMKMALIEAYGRLQLKSLGYTAEDLARMTAEEINEVIQRGMLPKGAIPKAETQLGELVSDEQYIRSLVKRLEGASTGEIASFYARQIMEGDAKLDQIINKYKLPPSTLDIHQQFVGFAKEGKPLIPKVTAPVTPAPVEAVKAEPAPAVTAKPQAGKAPPAKIPPPPAEPPVIESPEPVPPSGRPRTLLDLNREAKGMRAFSPEDRAAIMDVARPIKQDELLYKVKPFSEHADNLLQPDTRIRAALRAVPGVKQAAGVWTPAQMQRNNPVAMLGVRKAIFEEIEIGRARLATLNWWHDADELFNFKKIKGKWRVTNIKLSTSAEPSKPYHATIHDLIEHPDNYAFTPEQEKVLQIAQDMQRQILRDAQRVGVDAVELTGDYWRRIVTKAPKDKMFGGKVKTQIASRKGYTRQRAFDFVDDGANLGFEYETHPLTALQNRLEAGIRTISDQNTRQTMAKLPGVVKPLERLESRYPQTVEGVKTARQARDAAKQVFLRDKTLENETALRQAEADYISAMRELFFKKIEAGQPNIGELKLPNGRIAPAELVEEVRKWVDLPEIVTSRGAITSNTLAVTQLLRSTLTNVDLAAGFIQGQALFYRNNIAWWRSQGNALLSLIDDPTAYVAKNFDLMDEGMRMGAISIPIEFMFTRQGLASIPTRIPVVGPVMKSFNRAFEWFIVTGQTELYRATRSGAIKRAGGNEQAATDALVSLGSAIRKELGTESYAILGVRPTQHTLEQLALFAARFFRALTGIQAQAFTGGEGGREARRAMGAAIAGGIALTIAASYLTAKKMPNMTDPFNPDWMQFEIGKTRFNAFGPFYPYFRTQARVSVYMLRGKPIEAANEIKRFFQGKAGIPFRAIDMAAQFAMYGSYRTFEGKKLPLTLFGVGEAVLGEMAVPISVQEAMRALPQGRPEAVVGEVFGLVGREKYPWFPKETFNAYYEIPTDPDKAKAQRKPTRTAYRKTNSDVDAKLFITGRVGTVSTDRAVRAVIELVRKNKIDPSSISAVRSWQQAEERRKELGLERKGTPTLTEQLIMELLGGRIPVPVAPRPAPVQPTQPRTPGGAKQNPFRD